MYNRLIKKYYLYKLFTLALPAKINCNSSCLFLCSYFIKNTPYGDLKQFIREINRILGILLNSKLGKNIMFLCSSKIFFLDFSTFSKQQIELKCDHDWVFLKKKISLAILYNSIVNKTEIASLKKQKIPSIGFIDFSGQPHLTDYTLLLNVKSFSSLFLFHFILKKLVYVKN